MQKRYLSIATACLCLTTWLFLPGCGESIFKGLDGDTAPSTAQEAAESGDYAKALSLSQTIIDAPDSSDPEKQEAYAQKGTALMGIHDMSPISIASRLKDTEEDNIFDTLDYILPVTATESAEIADAFNMAYTLGGGDLGLSSLSAAQLATSSSSLDRNYQLIRGVANLSVVVKMTTRVFNVANDGTVSFADETETYSSALDYLMGGSRTVFYYAENAMDAFNSADAFTEDQLAVANKVRVVGLNLKNLHTAKESVGAGRNFVLKYYTSGGSSANVTGTYARTIPIRSTVAGKEADIKAALDAIFAYISGN